MKAGTMVEVCFVFGRSSLSRCIRPLSTSNIGHHLSPPWAYPQCSRQLMGTTDFFLNLGSKAMAHFKQWNCSSDICQWGEGLDTVWKEVVSLCHSKCPRGCICVMVNLAGQASINATPACPGPSGERNQGSSLSKAVFKPRPAPWATTKNSELTRKKQG